MPFFIMNMKFIKNEDKVIVSGIFYDLSKESKRINEVYNLLNSFGAKIENSVIQRLELEDRFNFFSKNHIASLKESINHDSISALVILNRIRRDQHVKLMNKLPEVYIYTLDELYSLYLSRNLISGKRCLNLKMSFLRTRFEIYDDYLNNYSNNSKAPEKIAEVKNQITYIEEEMILSNTRLEILNFSKETSLSVTEDMSIIFIGESGVGKSSLINSLKKYDLNQNFSFDIQNYFDYDKKMNSETVRIAKYNELELLTEQCEIVNQIIFHDIFEASKNSVICIVVDATRESVFEDMNQYHDYIRKCSPIRINVVSILTKVDMIDNDDIYSLRSVYPYAHFVSSHSNIGIESLKNDLDIQISRLERNDSNHNNSRIPLAGKWHVSKEENESF